MKNFFRKIIENILRKIASNVLKSKNPEIIAITGSVGKTSTREAIFHYLSNGLSNNDYLIWENKGNLNEEIGVPLTILGLSQNIRWYSWIIVLPALYIKMWLFRFNIIKYPNILILELAANKRGDIEYLVSFIKPRVAVITAIGPAHMEFFKTIENIQMEKGKILSTLTKNDWAVLNSDDKLVNELSKNTNAKILYFKGNDFNSAEECAKTIASKVYNIAESKILEAQFTFKPMIGRMNLIKGINNSLIIDDSYNANPLSMSRAIDRLEFEGKKKPKSRKVAILGDMLELGDYSKEAHAQIIIKALKIADKILFVGPNFAKSKNSLNDMSTKIIIECFKNYCEATQAILLDIKTNDIILIKGSHGMRLDKIVDKLKN